MQFAPVEFNDSIGRIVQIATLRAAVKIIERDEQKFRDHPEFLESLSRIKTALVAVAGSIENIGDLRKENQPELFDPRKHIDVSGPGSKIGSF